MVTHTLIWAALGIGVLGAGVPAWAQHGPGEDPVVLEKKVTLQMIPNGAAPRSGYMNGAELAVDGGMSSMLMDMVPRPGYNKTA